MKKIISNGLKTKNVLLSVSIITIAGFLGLALFNSVSAYQGDYTKKGPNYTEERHEAMEKAFENKDYTAWKSLMQNKGRVVEIINENNFSKFTEAHNLAKQGKYEEANKIRQELGLRTNNGQKNRAGLGRETNGRGQRTCQ